MFWIGIDPGLHGGIAVLDDELKVFELMVMPTIGKELDYGELRALIDGYGSGVWFIEQVHALHRAGTTSAFNFGRMLEGLKAAVAICGCRYQLLAPRDWQKIAWQGVSKVKRGKRVDTKATSLNAVKRLFPNVSCVPTERSKKPHDGMVDALLIAYAGRMLWKGGEKR